MPPTHVGTKPQEAFTRITRVRIALFELFLSNVVNLPNRLSPINQINEEDDDAFAQNPRHFDGSHVRTLAHLHFQNSESGNLHEVDLQSY